MRKQVLLCIWMVLATVACYAQITSASIVSYGNASCTCCTDGYATVQADNGSGTYSYSWSSGGSSSYESNLGPGNYSVTVTDLADNSTAVAGVSIGPSPGINTGSVPSIICLGSAVDVPFTTCGVFNTGNVFTAYLSDRFGSFASPVAIGSLTGTTSGTINATIPSGTIPGSQYRIRVDGSDPGISGNENGFDILIEPVKVTTSAITGSPFCSGGNIEVTYTVNCGFNAGNNFTVQLSNAAGSFASPVNIGSATGMYGGTITATIPSGTPTGSGYRVRIISTNPSTVGVNNGTNLIINQNPAAITTGNIPVLCPGSVDVPFTICGGFNPGNVFTAQLSDSAGSFAAPVNIGTLTGTATGTIIALVPSNTPNGSHYRIRVVSSNPVLTGSDNGTDLVINITPNTRAWEWAVAQGGYTYSGDAPNMDGNTSDVAADANGNSYVVGGFDTQGDFGGFNLNSKGVFDAFLVKYDSSGNVLWAKGFGGNYDDVGKSVAVDNQGNVCITGYYESDTMYIDGVKLVHNGGARSSGASGNRTGRSAIFTAKFSPNGTLLWARKAGGNFTTGNYDSAPNDRAYGITTDATGNVIITGSIASDTAYFDNLTLLVSPPYSGTLGRLFTAKYNSLGIIQWAKTIGVAGYGRGADVACDPAGNIFVTGVINGVFTFGGSSINTAAWDIFIGKYNASGNELWGRKAGSAPDDAGRAIAVDNNGDAYITGWLQAAVGVFGADTLRSVNNTTWDMFVAKYNGANGNVVWANRAGGISFDQGYGIEVDNCSNVYITGAVAGKGQTVYFDSLTVKPVEYIEAFVAMYDNAGKAVYVTSQGGPPSGFYNNCIGYGITTDATNNIIVTGVFTSPAMNFGCTSITKSGLYGNLFVAKLDNPSTNGADVDIAGLLNICEGDSTVLSATGLSNYTWSPPLGLNTNTGSTVVARPAVTTAYQVSGSFGGCVVSETAVVTVNPYPQPLVTISDTLLCAGDSAQVCVSAANASYTWNTGDSAACVYVSGAGAYWVTATSAQGCTKISDRAQLRVYPVTSVSVIVLSDTLTSFGAVSYQWYLNDLAISGATSPVYIAPQTGYYSVEVTDTNGCRNRSTEVYITVSGVGIQEATLTSPVVVYPNPAIDEVVVSVSAGIAVDEIQITDMLGHQLLAQPALIPGHSIYKVNISAFPAGVYQLNCYSDKQVIGSKLFVH